MHCWADIYMYMCTLSQIIHLTSDLNLKYGDEALSVYCSCDDSVLFYVQEKLEPKEARISQKCQEIEHLKKDISTADATIRKLMIKNSQLEAEKARLINEGHMYRYTNTKLEQTEREKAALLKQVEEQEQMIGRVDAKIN